VLGVLLAASAGCSAVRSPAPSATLVAAAQATSARQASVLAQATLPPMTLPPMTLPPVTGGGVRALWQGAPAALLTFDGGTLLGVGGQLTQVHAIAAATGKPLWTATMPKSVPFVWGLVPAGNVVVVEAAHHIGVAGLGVYRDIALDLKTGRTLWTAPVSGSYQSPPIAASGKYLLTGDSTDAVTARIAATGAVVWRDARPAGCGPPFNSVTPGVGLAADGSLVAASFYCGKRVVVRRLSPATGKALWTWRSPDVADAGLLTLAAAAGDGGLLLLTGAVGPPPGAQRFARALPNPHSWPAAFGPNDEESTVLALAASDGHPRWTEVGGQEQTFDLTAGAVCEVVDIGLECRGDATGTATMPTLLTGVSDGYGPGVVGDGPAGVADGLAAVTIGTSKPGVVLRVVRVRGGATVAQVRIPLGPGPVGTHLRVFAVAATAIGAHTIVVLLRRIDMPGDGNDPVLALAVRVPAGA
jgi:outer membrane protein assembly factor BamB